ncbi:MAG TPA: hypothetical protein VNR90_09770 [Vicinamibacterales bacterium]|nr:hypothetical protein [Vicinamibacterales bacterium]
MDTRLGSGSGYPAPWGTPNFAANEKRVVTASGAIAAGNPCANVIPTFATAIAANFTVVPFGGGDLRVAPGAPSGTLANSILNYSNSAIANAASVDIDGAGQLTLETAVSGASVIIDILGYYTREGTSNLAIVAGRNDGTGDGVHGTTAGTNSSSAGVSGSGNSGAYGVSGESSDNDGVHGSSTSGVGVRGVTGGGGILAAGLFGSGSGTAYGVYGSSSSGDGVHGIGQNGVVGAVFGSGYGVHGSNVGGSGDGVRGTADSAGVGVRAENTASAVALLVDGSIKVTGPHRAAFEFDAITSTVCTDSVGKKDLVLSSQYANDNPDALIWVMPISGQGLTVNVFYNPGGLGGNCPDNRWLLMRASGSDMSASDGVFSVLVIQR